MNEPLKLLCDEMLMRLGRWLRAAGYDTGLAINGENDRELFQRARRESRRLLTRDRKLQEYRHADGTVILLRGNALDEQVHELSQRLSIDWLYRPLSRCLVCNTPLNDGAPDDIPIPDDIDRNTLHHCPGCGRIYWEGSHSRRMRWRLEAWARKQKAVR